MVTNLFFRLYRGGNRDFGSRGCQKWNRYIFKDTHYEKLVILINYINCLMFNSSFHLKKNSDITHDILCFNYCFEINMVVFQKKIYLHYLPYIFFQPFCIRVMRAEVSYFSSNNLYEILQLINIANNITTLNSLFEFYLLHLYDTVWSVVLNDVIEYLCVQMKGGFVNLLCFQFRLLKVIIIYLYHAL